MARLTASTRRALPDSAFAGPGRTYPMEDKAHAAAAIGFAGMHHGKAAAEKMRKKAVARGLVKPKHGSKLNLGALTK
jgi:hypothetical protein